MAMLNYDAEIRRPEKMATSLKQPSGVTRQVRLAQTLVRQWSEDDFDFSQYEDRYRQRMQDLIKAKVEGREIVEPEEEEEAEVLSLMDALKKSLEGKRQGDKPKPRQKRRA